jgi:hypothetical protein
MATPFKGEAMNQPKSPSTHDRARVNMIRHERQTLLMPKPVRCILLVATILAVYSCCYVGLSSAQVIIVSDPTLAQAPSAPAPTGPALIGKPVLFTFDFPANGVSLPSASTATWDFDDDTTATSPIYYLTHTSTWRISVTHIFQTPGLYTVTGRIKDPNGVFLTKDIKQITISRIPDTTLSEFTLSAGPLSPAFNPAITAYNVSPLIGDDVTETSISATTTDSEALLQIKNGDTWGVEVPGQFTRVRAIPGCSTTITIRVSNHGDASRFILAAQTNYTVNISRLSCLPPPPPLPPPNLGALTVSAGTLYPNFDPNTTDYVLMPVLADGVIRTTITAVPANPTVQTDVRVNNGASIPLNVPLVPTNGAPTDGGALGVNPGSGYSGDTTATLELEGCSNVISVHTLLGASGNSKTYKITITKAGCVQGAQGAQGVPGVEGPSGPQGPQGDAGPAGPKGDNGETGASGAQGSQGPKGDKGDPGSQGPQGETGHSGPKGDKGDKGDIGAQGPQGEIGHSGPKGDKGDKGDPGAQGPQGEIGHSGPKGDKGDKGDIGAQGVRGDKGDRGEIGAQGPKGDKGEVGLPGMQGAQGPQGSVGPQGLPGLSGVQNVAGNLVIISSQTSGTTIATCPAGKTVIAGGYMTELPAGSMSSLPNMQVFSSVPAGTASWRVSGFNADSGLSGKKDLTLTAYAICAVVP